MVRLNFEKSGGWLFRWRSFLPLIMIGIFLLAMVGYKYPGNSEEYDHLWEAFCLVVSYFGLAIRILTIGYVPKGTSGRNTKSQVADALNKTGMYSIVRNPLYLGNFFMGLGIAFFPNFWWLTLIYILVFIVYYERIIFAEESFLRDKFGEDYLEWANRTPAFFPNFKNYVKPGLPFSVKNVLRREYNGFFAVIAVMFLLECIGDYFIGGTFEVDLPWTVLFCSGFLVWFVLRALKKYTTLLNVEGR